MSLNESTLPLSTNPIEGFEGDAWFGEPEEAHSHSVSEILQALRLDEASVTAARHLHSSLGKEPLTKQLGPDAATLLIGYRGLRQAQAKLIKHDGQSRVAGQEEILRKMLLAFGNDLRVVLIYLASRLQTLRWIAKHRIKVKPSWAQEILDIDASLANRLGIWQMKWEMEDLAFRFADEASYHRIARALDEKRSQRELFIRELTRQIELGLRSAGLDVKVSGRPKHIYSIYNKMRAKQLAVERLLDLRAIRIVVKQVDDCYAALDWVHKRFSPLLAEFDDYIARPKPNGYRSLHTVVLHEDARPVEIQIRTESMHREAELGFASHWHYKETSTGLSQSKGKSQDRDKIEYVRQLLAWKHDLIDGELPGSKSSRAIYVLTPQGKVLELPAASTPIDFAYLLHTDLGHRCRGAKIDGAMVPLNTRLRSGQTVEIIAARASEQLGPSRDWLNPALSYLGSPRARTKVRQWFHTLDEQRDVAMGRAKLEKLLQREGKTATAHDDLASRLGLEGVKALFLAFAREEISSRAVENALNFGTDQDLKREDELASRTPTKQINFGLARVSAASKRLKGKAAGWESPILVDGVASLLHHLAGCCRPIPPDDIAGFITRGEGVSVHRITCLTYGRLLARHPERAVQVSWSLGDAYLFGDGIKVERGTSGRDGHADGHGNGNVHSDGNVRGHPHGSVHGHGWKASEKPAFAAELLVRANDRPGLLRDLTELMSRLKVRMTSIRSYTKREQLSIRITLELSHHKELAFTVRKLRELPGVLLTTRIGD
ncbi:MAG: hypothetical protein RLZZ119_49 [Pseudomonadota bacterium]